MANKDKSGFSQAQGRKEMNVNFGYWLEFWWMFPIALTICITV
jgi:hypothetical protein